MKLRLYAEVRRLKRESKMADRARPDGDLRRIFREHLPHMHWTTIETGIINPGVPDSNCCWNGAEFWIEYKFTAGHAITLRPEQIGWLTRRRRSGGSAFVAVRRTSLAARCDELHLFDGSHAVLLREEGLNGSSPRLGFWAGGPPGWDWEAVAGLLTRRSGSLRTVPGLGPGGQGEVPGRAGASRKG